MKKRFLFILLCLFLLPMLVNAKENCKIISGNGKDIGSEIQCGTESFYVIENNNNQLKLLAKYNLNVGDKIDYFDFDEIQTFNNEDAAFDYCDNQAEEKGYHAYFTFPMYVNVNAYPYEVKGCRVYERMNEQYTRQDERAVGTKLVNGKSVLPLYGITYMNPNWGYDYIHNGRLHYNTYDDNGDLIIEGSSFEDYLYDYWDELEDQGFEVDDVSFITLSRTVDLLERISGREVTVDLEYDDNTNMYDWPEHYLGKMDITQYLNGGHKWLYDITYWLGSGFYVDNTDDPYNDYYISNEGMLCAIGRGECKYFAYPIGNGLRPLVTINEDNIKYMIKTITDGNGTIEVIDHASGSETIQFKVTAKKGYKLSKLIITSDSGEKIEFNEGSLINNADGTVSIDKNVFTMPFENVTIEARWSIANPVTGRNIALVGVILLLTIGSIFVIVKKNG